MLGKAALLFFTTAFAAAAPAYPSADESFEIYLKSRTFTFPEKHDEDLCCENAANAERIRVFLQPRGVPNVETRSTLEKRGIRLLDYVPNNRWFASVPAGLHVNSRVLQTIRWAGAILPGDKIAPSLREMEASGSSRTNDGRIYAVVKYFEDVDKEEIKKLVLKLDASLIGEIPETESFTISLPKGKIPDLVEDDGIWWVEPIPSHGTGESYDVGRNEQADIASGEFGLTGKGVIVGIFEETHVYRYHEDFSNRVARGDADPAFYGRHATNVAGLIGGEGSMVSDYRGVAPNVKMYSYSYSSGCSLFEQFQNYSRDLLQAIKLHRVDIANNSWGRAGCGVYEYGEYTGLCSTLDAAVHGNFGRRIVVVFSAGNERGGIATGGYPRESLDTRCITDTNPPYRNYRTLNHPKAAMLPLVRMVRRSRAGCEPANPGAGGDCPYRPFLLNLVNIHHSIGNSVPLPPVSGGFSIPA